MFNVGPAELLVIMLVALLIVGPKRLPEVGKSIGKALRELRRQTDEVRYSFEATLNPDDDDDEDVQATPEAHPSSEEKPGDAAEPEASETSEASEASETSRAPGPPSGGPA
ncbi:MAG TPA: twin-arginine translocase TatA/TatE family subunit [Actinomycetota bacterium]